jgi:hypothetical protein
LAKQGLVIAKLILQVVLQGFELTLTIVEHLVRLEPAEPGLNLVDALAAAQEQPAPSWQ